MPAWFWRAPTHHLLSVTGDIHLLTSGFSHSMLRWTYAVSGKTILIRNCIQTTENWQCKQTTRSTKQTWKISDLSGQTDGTMTGWTTTILRGLKRDSVSHAALDDHLSVCWNISAPKFWPKVTENLQQDVRWTSQLARHILYIWVTHCWDLGGAHVSSAVQAHRGVNMNLCRCIIPTFR